MHDLIIIGGGVGGSALAAAAARLGWDVLLVERSQAPRHKVCGEFISPEGLDSLCALGLHGQVAALEPAAIQQALLVGRRGAKLALPLPHPAWGLSRRTLDEALLASARDAGATVVTGASVTHWTREPHHFRVAVGGRWLEGRALVGAWGRQSPPGLRKGRPPSFKDGWIGVKQHLNSCAPLEGVELHFIDGGYIGLAPVENGRVNCSALVSRSAFLQAGGDPQRFFQRAMAQSPALQARLAGATSVEGSLVTVSGVDTQRQPLPWNGIPMLGDAAAMLPPLAGDGMAMALRAAELTLPLADAYLRDELSWVGWEFAYLRIYQAEFGRRLRTARLLQRSLVHPVAGDALLRLGRLLPGLAAQALLATRGAVAKGDGLRPPISS